MFGYEDADPERPAVAAGLMIFLIGLVLFEYKGAIFWKMTAGMGDVVIAPLYQALRRRGVTFEFFHRVDASAPRRRTSNHRCDHDGSPGTTVTTDTDYYEPLTPSADFPCFPCSPLADQIECDNWARRTRIALRRPR